MAMQRIDGFDYYKEANDTSFGLNSQWSSGYIFDKEINEGIDGGYHMTIPRVGGTENVYSDMPTSSATFTHGGWHKVSALNNAMVVFSHQDGTNQLVLYAATNGALELYRGTQFGGTLIATSAAGVLTSGAFYFIEARLTVHPSAGTADIIVGATSVISATGLNTRNHGSSSLVGRVEVCEPGSGTMSLDSFYWADDLTSRASATPYIETRWPLSTVGGGDFAASTGSDLTAMVDRKKAQGDLYITAGDINKIQMFEVDEFVPRTIASVLALRAIVNMKRADAVARTVSIVLDIGGTQHVGVAKALTGTSAFYWDLYELNPISGVAWTDADLASLKIGVKTVTGTAIADSYIVNSLHVEILRSKDTEAQAGGHRYWRFRPKQTQGDPRGGSCSIEFFDKFGARILGESYANGSYSGALLHTAANDGNSDTRWVTSNNVSAEIDYFRIDCGANKSLRPSGFKIGPQTATYTESLTGFDIGYSDDDVTWVNTGDSWTGEAAWSAGAKHVRRSYAMAPYSSGTTRRRNALVAN